MFITRNIYIYIYNFYKLIVTKTNTPSKKIVIKTKISTYLLSIDLFIAVDNKNRSDGNCAIEKRSGE